MSDPAGHGESAYFELSFSPNVSLVSTVRRFVSDFWMKILPSPEFTSQLAVATHELLDNAVIYSYDGNTHIRIDVVRGNADAQVSISTRNRATPDNVVRVRALLDELAAATDAALFYQQAMRRAAARSEGSGLGFARVRAEADMDVSYEIDGDVVQVRARANLPLEVR